MAIEDTMAQLANSQVMQSMPSLHDFVQGFQLIDSDEDRNAAIGVLVALMGETCIYVPAIYKDGKVFQMDIMYVPELDQFFPTTDNWISYLKSKKPDAITIELGKKERAKKGGTGSIDLDLPFNMISKLSSAPTTKELLEHAAECMVDVLVRKEASSFTVPDLHDIMSKVAAQEGIKFVNAIVDFPTTSNAFARYYNTDDLLNIAKKLEDKASRLTDDPSEKDNTDKGEVKLLTSSSNEAKSLSDAEKANILRDGAIIKDTRGLVPSKVYKAKQNNAWQTIGKTGMYELLCNDGKTMTAYVITHSNPKYSAVATSFYVIPLDEFHTREAVVTHAQIVGQPYPFELSQIRNSETFDNLKNIPGRDHFFVDTDGTYARVHIWHKDNMQLVSTDNSTRWTNMDCTVSFSGTDTAVNMIEQLPSSGKLRVANGVLYVPDTCRLIDVRDDGDASEVFRLATKETMLRAIQDRSQGIQVKIHNADGSLTVSDADGRITDNLNKNACAYQLVKDYFVTPEDAYAMIKEASEKPIHQARFIVKQADSAIFDATFSAEPDTQWQVDSVDMDAVLPADDRKALEIAANSGIKEVFDIETLRVLAQADSSVREIQEYIPALFSAMDRIARILYLTRAGESIADAYGPTKAAQMESKFKHLLVAIGDAIICLQQGRVDNIHDLLEGDLSNTIG
jgi:hypothetical protein